MTLQCSLSIKGNPKQTSLVRVICRDWKIEGSRTRDFIVYRYPFVTQSTYFSHIYVSFNVSIVLRRTFRKFIQECPMCDHENRAKLCDHDIRYKCKKKRSL